MPKLDRDKCKIRHFDSKSQFYKYSQREIQVRAGGGREEEDGASPSARGGREQEDGASPSAHYRQKAQDDYQKQINETKSRLN